MRDFLVNLRDGAGILILGICLSGLLLSGCTDSPQPAETQTPQTPSFKLGKDHPYVRAAMAAQERHTAGLMEDQDIVGTAIGLTDTGDEQLAIMVYTKRQLPANRIPRMLDGFPVVVEVTGEFKALKGGRKGRPGGGGGGFDPKAKQTPPIKLGTSGGWTFDLANGYCCGGTLGSLVTNGSARYILSNYHVLRADIVMGGNQRVAQNGDAVIQPGLIDVNCNANNAQTVGTLAGSASLPGSNVDAAVALVADNMVSSIGEILGIGELSSQTVAASLKQAVKKTGRTTGLSSSSVSGLNATVSVAYDNECAGGRAFVKTFTGQIIINNRRSKFLAGGDSGSLMVEDVHPYPRAVGLLYAGSSISAVANPIDHVLSWLSNDPNLSGTFSMVGR